MNSNAGHFKYIKSIKQEIEIKMEKLAALLHQPLHLTWQWHFSYNIAQTFFYQYCSVYYPYENNGHFQGKIN